MYRPDGSVISTNDPIWENRYVIRDYGFYKAQVTEVLFADDNTNSTINDFSPQVTYSVRILGGERDGQIFGNAVDMGGFGGISNYSERIWKGTTTILRNDPADATLPTPPPTQLNGDVVYIQFMNGDTYYPVILGGAKHAYNPNDGGFKSEHYTNTESFNGITSKIDGDGIFTWTKAIGLYSDLPVVNEDGQLLWDQFVPILGFEKAIEFTMNNEFQMTLNFNVTPATALSVTIDAKEDSLIITNITGAELELDGLSDSFKYTSLAGASLVVSGESGISAKDVLGDELSLANGSVNLKNATGAALAFNPAGFIKLGNSGGDLLKDIIEPLLQALTTEAPAGFGAPLSQLSTYIQLLVKIKLLAGG